MTEAATVCVALSVRDGGAYLSGSIASVLAQEDVALELRIYDNGSTDGSFELAERHLDDPRVSVTANPAGSRFFDSMNRALAETSARWLVPWAADDLMLPGSIATRLSAAQRSGAQFVFTPVVSIDSDGRPGRTLCDEVGDAEVVLDPPDLFPRIAPWNTVAMPAVMAETAALSAAGGFERRLARCGDWLMWLRLSLRVRSIYLPEPAVLYRVHDANDTHASRRAGAFATELVATIRAAFRDPAFPPAWQPLLRDHLISIMRGQATMHLHDGLVRASHCTHPAYLVAFEALLLDPAQRRGAGAVPRCRSRCRSAANRVPHRGRRRAGALGRGGRREHARHPQAARVPGPARPRPARSRARSARRDGRARRA